MVSEVKEGKGEGAKQVWLYKGSMRDPCGDGNVKYLDCVNVNILIVILYYYFTSCHHWGRLGKVFKGFL